MGPMKRVNTTMPESLLRKVDLYSELNLEDRATAIRQLVAEGLRVKLQQTAYESARSCGSSATFLCRVKRTAAVSENWGARKEDEPSSSNE